MKISLLSFVCLLFFCVGSSRRVAAQDSRGGITGVVTDSLGAKPIAYATVSVFRVADTALITFRLSDEKGVFRIAGLPLSEKLRVVISYTGYRSFRREVQWTAGSSQVDFGRCPLVVSSRELKEVVLVAERPPVVVRQDTIEFNAASFKTLPDALVEDLLRKLPGVSVDKDGNILVNGRRVSTIYVDGRDFFGGDVRVASRNLPANAIEKVQVTPDAEALKTNPFMREADIPQVINLKLKPGVKKGAFGKLYAGGGVHDKAEGGGLLNIFRDTTQMSLVGYGNNVNKAGFAFADLRTAGGFGRSGWGNANGNGNGGLSIDNVPFGGSGSGLQNSYGGGGNYNTIFAKKVQFNVRYFYGEVSSDYDEWRNTRQTYNDTVLNNSRDTHLRSNLYGHSVGTRVQFNIAPKLNFDFWPSLTWTNEHANQEQQLEGLSSRKGTLNKGSNNQQNKNTGYNYASRMFLTGSFKKKGRSLVITQLTLIDQANTDQYNQVDNVFYSPASVSTTDQLRQRDNRNVDIINSVRYTDPLTKSLSISADVGANWSENRTRIGTFAADGGNAYTLVVPGLTDNLSRSGWRSTAGASFRWKPGKLSLVPAIRLNSMIVENRFLKGADVAQRYFYVLPALDISYGIFSAGYSTSFREPAASYLQPVADNTNPLFVQKGNPDLKPARYNSANLGLRRFDAQRSLTYNFSVNASVGNNVTIVSRTLDANGVQTTFPVNADGIWQYGNNFSLQKDKKFAKNSQVSLIASSSLSYTRSLVLLNDAASRFQTFSARPSAEIRLNLNDKFELNQAYTFTRNKSVYRETQFTDQTLTYHDSRSELIVRLPQSLVWETTLDYRYNSNATPGGLKSYYKWNAAVTYIFLKGRRGQLKLGVNDLLDQNVIASRVVRDNLIEDMQGSTLRRYGMMTFTYNIRSFGEKVGGRGQLLRF